MDGCLFCGIAQGQIKANRVYHDQWVTAFRDINPQAPTHILIVPNEHIASVAEIGEDRSELLGKMFAVANQLAAQDGVAGGGYRLVINAGANAGQSVPHLHLHLLGGRVFSWPPG